jgi:hypothetical protein
MPFDDELKLIDGTIALDPTSDAAIASLTRDAYGKVVVDIKKTGQNGLFAVLICPTAPTTYQDTLATAIQHSNQVEDGWEDLAVFPTLYAYMREVFVTTTTAFVGTDIGLVLTATTDSASDGGIIIDFDRALLTLGATGKLLVEMSDANDDYSTSGDIVTATSGTGVGTISPAGAATSQRSYGIYVVRFQTNRRYIRPNLTVSSGGSWGLVSLLVTDNYPMSHVLP